MRASQTLQTDCTLGSLSSWNAQCHWFFLGARSYVLWPPRNTSLRCILQKSEYQRTFYWHPSWVSIYRPIIETYKAAHAFANSSLYSNYTVSREEYNEGGSNACRRKFRQFDWDPIKEKPQAPTRPPRRDKNGAGSRGVVESGDEDSEVSEVKKVVKRSLAKKREKVVVAPKTKRDTSRR